MFQHTQGEQGSQHPAQPLGSSTESREGDAAGIMISLAWASLPDLGGRREECQVQTPLVLH